MYIGTGTTSRIKPTVSDASPFAIPQPYKVLHKYPSGQSSPTKEHHQHIRDIARLVIARQHTSQPIRRIQIVGHSDHVGEEIRNCSLGMRRAREAAAAILNAIFEKNRRQIPPQLTFAFESSGEIEPVSDNRALNRRVEVFLSTVHGAFQARGKCRLPGQCICRQISAV